MECLVAWIREAPFDERVHGTDDGVRVTWGLSGTASGPLGGYFAKMMDGWVGADYEDGLARLKQVAESVPAGELPTVFA